MKKHSNISIGQVFGQLTVIAFSERTNAKKVSFVFCNCSCGFKNKEFSSRALISRNTRSCGCSRRKPERESLLIRFERDYKINARNRNLEWQLSTIEFREISKLNCYWCDEIPKKRSYAKSLRKKDQTIWALNQYIIVNGLDRLNNSLGYTKDNCVPCCTICNNMKKTHMPNEFLDHIRKIYEFKSK